MKPERIGTGLEWRGFFSGAGDAPFDAPEITEVAGRASANFLTFAALSLTVGGLTGGLAGVLPGFFAGVAAGGVSTFIAGVRAGLSPARTYAAGTLAAIFAAGTIGYASMPDYQYRPSAPSIATDCLFPAKPVVSCLRAVTGYLTAPQKSPEKPAFSP